MDLLDFAISDPARANWLWFAVPKVGSPQGPLSPTLTLTNPAYP